MNLRSPQGAAVLQTAGLIHSPILTNLASSRSVLTTATAAFAGVDGSDVRGIESRSQGSGAFPPTAGGPHGLLKLGVDGRTRTCVDHMGQPGYSRSLLPLGHAYKQKVSIIKPSNRLLCKQKWRLLSRPGLARFGGLYLSHPSGNTRPLSSNELLYEDNELYDRFFMLFSLRHRGS